MGYLHNRCTFSNDNELITEERKKIGKLCKLDFLKLLKFSDVIKYEIIYIFNILY